MEAKTGQLATLLLPFDPDELGRLAGVTTNTVRRWQNGLRLPRRRMVHVLAEATGLAPEALRDALRADLAAK